jgi:transmembrane sensor
MKYLNYTTDDFLSDDAFVNWVLHSENEAFWLHFLNENPLQKPTIDKARDFIQAAKQVDYPALTPSVKMAMWSHIQEGIAQEAKPIPTVRLWRIAAAVAFLAVAGGALFYFLNKTTPSVLTGENNIAKVVTTEYQQRKQLTLPDGSIVTLNAHSNLKVSDNWDDTRTREVWLDGEAFFEVVKKPNTGAAKFVVHTSQLSVEVLGTAFNVKTRRGATEVVLQSGKVRLKKTNNNNFKEIEMSPGERIKVVEELPTPIIAEKVETEKITAWTNGKIIFDNTPLLEVAKAIEDHFGYIVTIADKDLTTKLYTGELLTDSPDVFFTILSKTLNINIDINGKNLILKRK